MPEIRKGLRLEFVGLNGEVIKGRVTSIDYDRDLVYVETPSRKKPLIVSRFWLMHEAQILKMNEVATSYAPLKETKMSRPKDWWKKVPAFAWVFYIIGLLFVAFGVESFWDDLARDNRGYLWWGLLIIAVGFFVHWRSHAPVE